MSKDTERVRGFAIVRSESAISSSRSVCVNDCTFSMEGVFPTVDEEFVAEVIQPLVCSTATAAPASPLATQQQQHQDEAQQVLHAEEVDAGGALPPPPPLPVTPSRAVLVWSSGGGGDIDSTVLRATLDSIVSSNPESTICFGMFSTTTAASSVKQEWNQWAKRIGSPRSSRGATPPSSARGGDSLPPQQQHQQIVTPRFQAITGLAAREFEAFRHFKVDGESVLGLFPLQTSTRSRVSEPPKPYAPLVNAQELLMQFHTVANYCNSNRRGGGEETDAAIVVVDIVVASHAHASVFRLRYVHCLSSGAVKQLLSSSSRVSLSANIAAEIFSNCRTHCVLLYNDPDLFTGAGAGAGGGGGCSGARRADHKSDFQLLQMTRSHLNYVSSRPPRFSPEALLSYLGVRFGPVNVTSMSPPSITAAAEQPVATGTAAGGGAASHAVETGTKHSADGERQQIQQHTSVPAIPAIAIGRHAALAVSSPLGADADDEDEQQQQQQHLDDEYASTSGSASARAAAGLDQQHRYSGSGSNEVAVSKMRREIVALNDLVVELRTRALRSEELLREERLRNLHLCEDNEKLRAALFTATGGTGIVEQEEMMSVDASGALVRHAVPIGGGGGAPLPLPSSSSVSPRGGDPVAAARRAIAIVQRVSGGGGGGGGGGGAPAPTTSRRAVSASLSRQSTAVHRGDGAAAISRQSTATGRTQSPLARQPTATSSRPNAMSVTPRAVAAALDSAARRASPAASQPSNVFRREAPWVARRAVKTGHFAETASQRRQHNHGGVAAGGAAAHPASLASLRVVTSHTRPKLVTALRGENGTLRNIRHNEWEDPSELMAREDM